MGPFGSDIKVEYFVDKGVPVLNGSNISGFKVTDDFHNYVTEERASGYRKAIAVRGDIVITHRGTLGQIAYIPDDSQYEKYVISQSQFKVRLDTDKVNPVYFTYYFHTNEGQQRLLSFKSHVGVPALAQATTNFRLLDFPLIPKPKQDAIASVLKILDQKIELNNQINAELEAMAKTLYDYWFVQFDFPDANGKPYKSSGGKMVYNKVLKREIPEGWEVKPVSEIIEVRDGTHDSPKPSEKGEYLITSKHLQPSGIDFSNAYFISYEDFEAVNKRSKVDEGDFLISMIGTIGLSQWVMKITTPFAIKNIGLFKTSQSPEYADYIFASVTSSYGKAYLQQNQSTGTSQPYVTLGTLRGIPITIPSKNVFDDFNTKVKPTHKLLYENATENQKLVELRDWLLPMLMNGQVTVK